jgi:transcriptional regulator
VYVSSLMLVQRHYAMAGMAEVRRLITAYGWAVLVTHGLRAAHVPCLLDADHDPGGDEESLVVLSHTARIDPASEELASGGEVLIVFQGPNGYISPAWYEAGPYVPTWNFMVAHVYGVPELLEGDEGFAVLERTVDHFEAARESPWRLDGESLPYARRIAPGTVPFRLRATRVEAKAKLSQDKPPEVQDRVIAGLERPGPYRQPELAEEMRRALGKPTR